jgi:CDP-2,3-bis-(O-geranylgeranyl)-sn-glycerol synthase
MNLEEHSFIQVLFIVLWIMMPAYLSNTFAVISGGRFPIDQGKIHSDGNRILGDGKTWSGLIGGTTGGILIGYLQMNYGNSIINTLANTNNYYFFISFWCITRRYDCLFF